MVNITFKTLKQEIYNLDANITITIADLKQQLIKYGLDPEDIKLIFKGRILENANTLETYKYNSDSKDFIVIMAPPKKIQPVIKQPVNNQPVNNQPVNNQPTNDLSLNDLSLNEQLENQENQENDDDYEDTSEEEPPNIANALQQNPEILIGLMSRHPQMSQLLNQYPDEIQELVSSPNFMQSVISMGNNGVFNVNQNTLQINITEEERNDINELMSLGFTENEVMQVYFACNKNKEQAASMLFEDIH